MAPERSWPSWKISSLLTGKPINKKWKNIIKKKIRINKYKILLFFLTTFFVILFWSIICFNVSTFSLSIKINVDKYRNKGISINNVKRRVSLNWWWFEVE